MYILNLVKIEGSHTMSINIRQDIEVLHNYVNSLDPQTIGLWRGNDGVLRKVTINDPSTQTTTLSNIIQEILHNSSIATLSKEEFGQFVSVVNKLPSEESFLK